jgi:hypothetical protein
MNMKREFIELLLSTGREGMSNVIVELGKLGFFEAPASAHFHFNRPGGLLEHSLNVYKVAKELRAAMIRMRPELDTALTMDSLTIAALLHDVCKAGIYKPTVTYRRNDEGKWDKLPGYDVDYSGLPLGHGEKSVIMLQMWGLKLTLDEILAIRWHMGAWDLAFQSAEQKANLNVAKAQAPLCTIIRTADELATTLLED